MAKDARMPALNVCRETLSPKPADDKLLTAKKSDSYRSRISTQNRGNSTLAMELYYEALKLDPIDVTSHQQSRNPLGKVRTVSRGRKSFAEDL
jgi:hypothetical protein